MKAFQARLKVMEAMRLIGSRGESVFEKVPGYRYVTLLFSGHMGAPISHSLALQV